MQPGSLALRGIEQEGRKTCCDQPKTHDDPRTDIQDVAVIGSEQAQNGHQPGDMPDHPKMPPNELADEFGADRLSSEQALAKRIHAGGQQHDRCRPTHP